METQSEKTIRLLQEQVRRLEIDAKVKKPKSKMHKHIWHVHFDDRNSEFCSMIGCGLVRNRKTG